MVHRSPELYGLGRSRWWLAGLRQSIPLLGPLSLTGVHLLLRRLKVHYKRGRRYLHSPDVDYDDKLAHIAAAYEQAVLCPEQSVFLYQDEFTYYRAPGVAASYGQAAADDVRADLGYRFNLRRRIAACVDALTGQVLAQQRASFRVSNLIRFFQQVDQAFPLAQHIFIVLDNWPVHFHDRVVRALQATKITLLPLPTYAPWLNPTEKVWLKLCQEVLWLHRLPDDWLALQNRVQAWLDQFQAGSPDLLRCLGLLFD